MLHINTDKKIALSKDRAITCLLLNYLIIIKALSQ